MDLEVDVSSLEAVYEQIVRQVRHAVQRGLLAPGAALPSIRQLADDLDLNHNTVARAYKILENDRVIQTAGRKGTFIHRDAASHIDTSNAQDATYQMRELVAALRDKGLSGAEIAATFEYALASTGHGDQK